MTLLERNHFEISHDSTENILIFLHLEKTGGSTLTNFFRSIFSQISDNTKYAAWMSDNEIKKSSENKKNQDLEPFNTLRVLCGHFSFGVEKLLPIPKKPFYFTVIREPLERVISWYFYQQKTKNEPGSEIAQKLNLDEWIMKHISVHSHYTSNFQTRRIMGKTLENKEENIPIAINHIKEKYYLAITNQHVDSFMQENMELSLLKSLDNKKVNTKKKTDSISDHTRQLFHDNNILDTALYNYISSTTPSFKIYKL